MRPQHIMFLGLVLVIGVLLSLCLGSLWLDTQDIQTINSLQMFSDTKIFGLFSMPVPNLSFFLIGMKNLTTMNFAFFTGELAILKFVLIMVIISGVLWGFFSTIVYVGTSILNRI